MARVVPITEDLFDQVYHDILIEENPDLPREVWESLFSFERDLSITPPGYAMLDGSQIAGILGTLSSSRKIDGRAVDFCNLHTWVVKPEFRGQSLLLMRKVLTLRNCVVTDLTPIRRVRQISMRLGFECLDSTLRILLPTLSIGHFDHVEMQELDGQHRLESNTLQTLKADHHHEHFGHLRCRVDDEECYVIYTRVDRWKLNYCQVHYVSNKRLFATHSKAIRQWLMRRTGTSFVAVLNRNFPGVQFPRSFRLKNTAGQLVRGGESFLSDIDTLYTDVSLLNLSGIAIVSSLIPDRLANSVKNGLSRLRQTSSESSQRVV